MGSQRLRWNRTRSERLARTASLLGLLLALGGCHAAPAAQFPSVNTALEQLRSQTDCSRAVMGDADLVVSHPLMQDTTGQLLYKAEAPDRVRFDLYSSFGVTLYTLTSDGKKFSLYNLGDRSFFYGPARTCNLQRFTRVQVPPFALVELLRGRPPVLAHEPGQARLRFSRPLFSRGRYIVDIEGQNRAQQRLEIAVPDEDWHKPTAEQRLRLVGVRVRQDGDLLYQVELSGHRPAQRAPIELTEEEIEMGIPPHPPSGPACEAELPTRVAFSVPNTGAKLTIVNRESFHNPPAIPDAFTQAIPGGVQSAFSGCTD